MKSERGEISEAVMGRRRSSYRKLSPLPMDSLSPSNQESPDAIVVNIKARGGAGSGLSSRSKSRSFRIDTGTKASGVVVSPPGKTLTSIAELKDLASSTLDDLKRHLDRSNSEILKDFEASQSRLHKRFKMQTQSCQQIMDKVDEEHKKISEQINESQQAMKESYREFMEEAQSSTARLCKTSIPELQKSVEKAIADLRSRCGLSPA